MTSNAIELHAPAAALAIRPGQQMWSDKQVAALAVLGIKGATKADLAVFMHYCQKTGLDPFSRQIYGIMRREKSGGEWVDKFTIQVGIDGFRVIRDRVAERLGVTVEYEDTIWYDADGGEHKIWLWEDPPAGCNVTVVKDGHRFPGVLRFASYAARSRDGDLVSQWKTQPDHMIEKCAEAFALRRAFPNDLAGVRLDDEMPPAEPGAPATIRSRGRVTVAEVVDRQPAGTPPDEFPDREPDGGDEQPPAPARASTGQLSMIGRTLKRLGVEDEKRPGTLERLAGRDLTADAPLTEEEGRRIRGLLDRCGDRAALVELLATGQLPEAGDDDA
jgi:phage recombination protein Bet